MMTAHSKHDRLIDDWFWIGIAALFLISLFLRFWQLSRFNTLVFDEVYYAKFASAFLQGKQDFGGHPPLSTYLIAGGIQLARTLGWGDPTQANDLTGLMLTTYSYRWLNALTGAFIPLVIAAIAYQLSQRRSYALLAGAFAAMDGLLLVESRYALNNVYLILFGLLGQLGLLLALNSNPLGRWGWIGIAGLFFGASAGIKWNGLGFLLAAYALWGGAWALRLIQQWRSHASTEEKPFHSTNPLENLTQLHLGHIVLGLALVPALTYYLSWLPYIQLDPSTTFLGWQNRILDYHKQVGGMDVHPYCSPWYTWLFMVRPVAYFYTTATSIEEPIPITDTPISQDVAKVVYDVHAMGNPFLWWFATAAILLMIGLVAQEGWRWVRSLQSNTVSVTSPRSPGTRVTTLLSIYLVVNWGANLLPWVEVSRCTFLYHYMASSIFALLAIAWVGDRWLQSLNFGRRAAGVALVLLVLAAFLFWLPMYLGIPLSPFEFRLRQWFPTWI